MMRSVETRKCQNCKQEFTIEPEDFQFYEKIKVPPPTWCPECRLRRRFIWRNERNLVKRGCDLCKKDMLAVYDTTVPFPVYCPECWRSDGWDPLSYAQDYDFTRPFFEQFRALMARVPRPALSHNGNNINCEYANIIQDVKNVYFSFSVAFGSEDVYYSNVVDRSRRVFDSLNVLDSELIYGSIGSVKNYRCRFCYWSSGCADCMLMLDSTGCLNCFGCVGLRNQKYRIFNEQYSKEEYDKKFAELRIGSYTHLQEAGAKLQELASKMPRKYARIVNSPRSTGDDILNSKNVRNAFMMYNAEDGRYLFRTEGPKQAMDANYLGNAEYVYEHASGGSHPSQEIRFIIYGLPGQHHVSYSDYCGSSSYLFGCIGLRNKEYCILNKRYTKEEYEETLSKIIEHMNAMPYTDEHGNVYRYGEFFPPSLSPFAYNESVAVEHLPLSKEQAEKLHFRWEEKKEKEHQVTLPAEKLADDITEAPDSITKEVIGCLNQGKRESCTKAFRIVPEELAFYRLMNVPLPRLCPNCRHYERLKQRNPLRLWRRKCVCAGQKSDNGVYENTVSHFHGSNHCPNEFETSYAPDRQEIVYCESCYNSEVV